MPVFYAVSLYGACRSSARIERKLYHSVESDLAIVPCSIKDVMIILAHVAEGVE